MRTALVVTAVAVSLAGCGGLEKTPVEDCDKVSNALRAEIASATKPGLQFDMPRAAAYRSPDYPGLYFIASELEGPGLEEGDTAVWATSTLSPGGAIFAVDGFAKSFTSWRDSDEHPLGFSSSDPSIDKARGCLVVD